MNVGSLFAGVGGFDLGLERAGMVVDWQVEIDPCCRAVLARHFPEARRHEDIRQVGAECLAAVDLISGGFPCQDLSAAGKGAGIDGARSGLWSEFARIVRELRPRYVLVENVPALLTGKGKRWDRAPVGRVLGDLAEAGYDAEWACLSAREFGAPHLRKRVWIVAYPARDAQAGATSASGAKRKRARSGRAQGRAGAILGTGSKRLKAGAQGDRETAARQQAPLRCDADGLRQSLADSVEDRCREGLFEPARQGQPPRPSDALGSSQRQAGPPRRALHNADCERHRLSQAQVCPGRDGPLDAGWWAVEPDVGRVADGVPARVDRLAALGNALLPQIAEWIGRRIVAYEELTG